MKSPMSSHRVLKSLAELSPELLGAKAAPLDQTEPQHTQALTQETEQLTIQPFPTVFDIRGYRGWGINE
jgi:hypothetical protein